MNMGESVGNTCDDVYVSNDVSCTIKNSIVPTSFFDNLKNFFAPFFPNYEKDDSMLVQGNFTKIRCMGDAGCIHGIVTKIIDGDTLDVNNTRIRLSMVNTPEFGERGYNEAKELLFSFCGMGSKVIVDVDDGQKEGSYGRTIGLVYCENNGNTVLLNKLLLDDGKAKFLYHLCTKSEFAYTDWAHRYGCY